jgi:hypothetical protein
MPKLARALAGAAVALTLASSAPARADEASMAESLFQQGVAAMDKGDLPRACEMLAESQRLDPGGGTLLNLALCHERAGHTATAWARYLEALGVARRDKRDDRIAFAEEHIRALEPRLPRLVISLAERVDGVRVKVDGVELRADAWEVPSPIDPGEHVVRVEAPGRREHTTKVAASAGETKRIVIPALARDVVRAPPEALAPTPPPPPRGGTQRTAGWVLTGVGGAALVGTAVVGALAIGAESTADAACPGAGACTDQRGLDASNRATNLSTAATITGISGAVLLAGGVILLLTAPR